MLLDFEHNKNAGGWQISSTGIIAASLLDGALDVLLDARIENIRNKSLKMTKYMISLIENVLNKKEKDVEIVTPQDETRRGGHIAIKHKEARKINSDLINKGIIHDFRPPDVLRFTPSPLYNTYREIWVLINEIKDTLNKI